MITIANVKLKCPECGLVVTVSHAEPDIDGDGSLGCPSCLATGEKRIVLNGTEQEIAGA